MLGGLTEEKPRDDKVDELIKVIKSEFQKKNYSTNIFEAEKYKTQIVNGTNYFIKVKTDMEYVHLRIYQSLPHNNSEITYHSDQLNKNKEDEIIYF